MYMINGDNVTFALHFSHIKIPNINFPRPQFYAAFGTPKFYKEIQVKLEKIFIS